MNIKVTNNISFGKVRSFNRCRICGEKVDKIGVRIKYLSNTRKNGKVHDTIHFDCAFGLRKKVINSAVFHQLVTTNRYGCSYCGKINPNKEIKNIGSVYLHPACCDLMEKKLSKLFEENKDKLMLSLI